MLTVTAADVLSNMFLFWIVVWSLPGISQYPLQLKDIWVSHPAITDTLLPLKYGPNGPSLYAKCPDPWCQKGFELQSYV